MTEGLWEGEDGGQGWGMGIALGGGGVSSLRVRRGRVAGKGLNGARLCQRKEGTGWFLGAGRGGARGWPAWRRFRSLGSEAVLGSWLEPLISKRRVTWMPGIPEPGLFRCALPPPPTLLPAPRPPRCGGTDSGTKGLGLAFPVAPCFPQGRPPAPPPAPQPRPPPPLSRICSQRILEAAAPSPQSFILVVGDGQGLKPQLYQGLQS